MNENQKMLFDRLFELDISKEPIELLEGLEGEINTDSKLEIKENIDEDKKIRVIKYDMDDKLNRILILSIAAGLPSDEFLKAENIYRKRGGGSREKKGQNKEQDDNGDSGNPQYNKRG